MEEQELIDRIVKGELKFHELDKYVERSIAVELRRKALEILTGEKLTNISKFSFDIERAEKANIENLIGVAQIPMGVAGPLRVRGDYAVALTIFRSQRPKELLSHLSTEVVPQ